MENKINFDLEVLKCKTAKDVNELVKKMTKSTLEKILQAELDEHLGYSKHESTGKNSGNREMDLAKKQYEVQWEKWN